MHREDRSMWYYRLIVQFNYNQNFGVGLKPWFIQILVCIVTDVPLALQECTDDLLNFILLFTCIHAWSHMHGTSQAYSGESIKSYFALLMKFTLWTWKIVTTRNYTGIIWLVSWCIMTIYGFYLVDRRSLVCVFLSHCQFVLFQGCVNSPTFILPCAEWLFCILTFTDLIN